MLMIVLIGGTALAFGLAGGPDEQTRPASITEQLAQAGQNLGNAAAVHYRGTLSSSGAETINVDIRMTKAGSASGSLTIGDERVDILSIDGKTFVKGGEDFWRAQSAPSEAVSPAAKNWGTIPAGVLEIGLQEILVPATIAQQLGNTGEGQARSGGTTTINGSAALKVTTPQSTYYVTTEEPYKIVRIEGIDGNYQVDVAELPAADVDNLFQELRDRAGKLGAALHPTVIFEPHGKLTFGDCGTSGCTVKATVSTDQEDSVSATMKVKMTGDGRSVGSCSATKTVKAGESTSISCAVRGGAWTSWYNQARNSPGRHVYRAQVVSIIAKAMSKADARSILDKVDQEAGR